MASDAWGVLLVLAPGPAAVSALSPAAVSWIFAGIVLGIFGGLLFVAYELYYGVAYLVSEAARRRRARASATSKGASRVAL